MKHILPAFAFALTLTRAFAGDELTTKKGACLGAKGGDMRLAEEQIESLNVGWQYNWTASWKGSDIKGNEHRPEEVLRFMKSVLPKLDELDFVEHYAWFTAPPDSPKLGSSALFDKTGKLTELGEFYAGHGK